MYKGLFAGGPRLSEMQEYESSTPDMGTEYAQSAPETFTGQNPMYEGTQPPSHASGYDEQYGAEEGGAYEQYGATDMKPHMNKNTNSPAPAPRRRWNPKRKVRLQRVPGRRGHQIALENPTEGRL